MMLHRLWSCAFLLPLLLAGCGAHPVNAPVDTRSNQQGARVATQPRAQPPQAKTHASHYVVQRGDTLYSIAWQHGLTYRQLADINGIRPPYTIYRGQRLRVQPLAQGRARAPLQSTARATPQPRQPEPVAARTPVPPTPVTAARASVATADTVAGYDGKWVWPTRGRLLRGFQPDAAGRKGIDIGGNSNQPVNAAANGKVVYAGSGLVGYGRLIIVKHNENLLSAYGHNNKLLVAEGEYVKAGQTIATMGSSGTDHTGLYFEVRKNGKPVDPLDYLPRL